MSREEEIRAKVEKIEALKKANEEYEIEVHKLKDGVPESEVMTWVKQELEARAYLLDNTASTPLIDGIVSNRGVPKEYLVNKIIEKADLYADAVGKLTGFRQGLEDVITQ